MEFKLIDDSANGQTFRRLFYPDLIIDDTTGADHLKIFFLNSFFLI